MFTISRANGEQLALFIVLFSTWRRQVLGARVLYLQQMTEYFMKMCENEVIISVDLRAFREVH